MRFGLGLSLKMTHCLIPFINPFPLEGLLQYLKSAPVLNDNGDYVIVDSTPKSVGNKNTIPNLIINDNSSGYFYSDYFNQDSKVVRLTLTYDGSGNWTVSDEDATLITVTGVTPDFDNDTNLIFGNGVEPLPMDNIVANYVMQDGELIDKVGGAGQELLFPCFKGDGSSSSHNISIPYSEFNFNITDKFSIAFDVYVREKGTFQGLIVKRGITSADYVDWFVNISNGNLSFNISNGSDIYQVYFSVEDDTKYSVVVTWDGTLNVSSNLKIYANNVIKRSTSITASPQTSIAGLVIGSDSISKNRYYTYCDIYNFGFYSEVLSTEEIATLNSGRIVTDNREAYFPLIGHGYGFKADNSVITGTPSNDTCFEGLTLFNPREGYNLSSGDNLVIPQSRQTPLLDVEGANLDDFKGGNAMPPYAVYNAKNLTGDFASVIKAIMLRNDDATITDRDNQKYGYDADNEYYWNVSTLLRLPEFIKSLQPDWYLFLKKRVSDGALEQIVVYRSGYKNALFFNGTDSYIDLGNSTS